MSKMSDCMCEDAVARHAYAQLASMLAQVPANCHFRVHAAYDVHVDAAWRFTASEIDDQHLFFGHSGSGSYRIEGHEFPIARGRLVWLTHGIRRSGLPDPDELPSFVSLRFGLHRNIDGCPADRQLAPSYVALSVRDVEWYDHQCSAIVRESERERRGGRHLNLPSALIHCVLGQLCLDVGWLLEGTSHDSRIEHVRRHIDINPSERLSLQAMAERAGLSERHFASLFRRQVGVSPKRYQVRARMRYARMLLRESGLSVKECAYHLGYSDPFNFSRHYRREFGLPPSEDRHLSSRVPWST